MLYMLGKIFLSGVGFDRVYNELVNKNMIKYEKTFFPTEFKTKYQSF